jgi:bifunctional UDP-N-acetylglucosamine pyrophosphorylase / glucosamine-1-phosphate N-acetyltransferase
MELKPRSYEKVLGLVKKGVNITNPLTLDIGDEVNIDHISAKGVKIYPGCRIYGEKVVISAGTEIGAEGPATIIDCQIGANAELRAGYFSTSVFLRKVNMALGAHVREGCILEEEANGAHCVGLKQTILFPFVTLGSLINFCDCLMAGGTSRRHHSEVGSSYIHFNFTPDGDKTTPSLIGDVPRGVMLNQPPIFLGGHGGMVGPLRMGYGNVVAAGSILRSDYPTGNKLIMGRAYPGAVRGFIPAGHRGLARIVEKNIVYLANLAALEEWYLHVRKGFLETEEFGALIFQGLLDKLALARRERLKRLRAMAERVATPQAKHDAEQRTMAIKEFADNMEHIEALFLQKDPGISKNLRDAFLADFEKAMARGTPRYIEAVQSLPTPVSRRGVMWLDNIVTTLTKRAKLFTPSLYSTKA